MQVSSHITMNEWNAPGWFSLLNYIKMHVPLELLGFPAFIVWDWNLSEALKSGNFKFLVQINVLLLIRMLTMEKG